MTTKLDRLDQLLKEIFQNRVESCDLAFGEITIVVSVSCYLEVAKQLRDDERFGFQQLIDLSGIDYSTYAGWSGKRFAAVSQLLSVKNNWRLRVKAFAEDDEFPVLPSLLEIWNSVNWFEREAFDLFGIHFEGHPDLRRILTDYGFIGHPFRKDFPVSGHVEMRYDPEQQRVVYQPVTIAPREVVPRIVREKDYGKAGRRA